MFTVNNTFRDQPLPLFPYPDDMSVGSDVSDSRVPGPTLESVRDRKEPTPVRPGGVTSSAASAAPLHTPIQRPVFVEALVRPANSAHEAQSTRARNGRESFNSHHCKPINGSSGELQRCRQVLTDGTPCPNLYKRTRTKKMCGACFVRRGGDQSSDNCSTSSTSPTSCDSSASPPAEETSDKADIRLVRLYTRGVSKPDEGTMRSVANSLAPAAVAVAASMFSISLGVLMVPLVTAALVSKAYNASIDGGSRRDPRLNDTYKDLHSSECRTFTKDEMLVYGYGGYIEVEVDWNAVLWLRSNKRVKATRSNANAILAYLDKQYPENDNLELMRNTAAYFLEELQQDQIYFDHHTSLSDSGSPPSYPDGHWRPN